MAKRFTDTEKWRDEWWGSLSNDYRIVWLYLVDSCSIAGIWKKDFRGLNFNCNTNVSEEEFLEVFGARVVDKGNFFFIPKFVRFQCPKGLKSHKPAVVSIVKELQDNNLIQILNELYGNDYLIIKDKGKGKDKGKDKGKEGEKEKEYVTIGESVLFEDDVMKVIEFREAAFNGKQKEHQTRSWKDVVPEWFAQALQQDFNNEDHLRNSFAKYLITHGKAQKITKKYTAQELAGI